MIDDPQDLAAFGEAILALLDDRERAERLGSAAHLRVKERFLGIDRLVDYLDIVAGIES